MHFETVRLDSLFVKPPMPTYLSCAGSILTFSPPTISDEEWLEIRNGLIFPDEPSVNLRYADIYNEIHKS